MGLNKKYSLTNNFSDINRKLSILNKDKLTTDDLPLSAKPAMHPMKYQPSTLCSQGNLLLRSLHIPQIFLL